VNNAFVDSGMVQRLRRWATAEHLALVGIAALLLGGLRSILEPYRMATWGQPATSVELQVLQIGAAGFVAASLAAVLLHAFGRDRLAVAVVVACIFALAAYKLVAAPAL
jgi:hypothetical protein